MSARIDVTADSDGVILDIEPQRKEIAMGIARKVYYYDKRAKRRNPPIKLSPKESLGIAIAVAIIFWPFCICVKGSIEWTIALIWWGLLAVLIINQKQKEKRGKKPKRPFV